MVQGAAIGLKLKKQQLPRQKNAKLTIIRLRALSYIYGAFSYGKCAVCFSSTCIKNDHPLEFPEIIQYFAENKQNSNKFLMVLEFSITNFRSIKDKQTFSMIAESSGKKGSNVFEQKLSNQDNIRVLKTAVVYGANASGKSNIIWAFYEFKKLVLSKQFLSLIHI